MNKLILLLTLFLTGCSNHYSETDFDLISINEAAHDLLESETKNGYISAKIWPEIIIQIKPEFIRKTEKGLFVALDTFFITESGIFIPSKGISVVTSKGYDPDYKLLGNNVYSYIIRG